MKKETIQADNTKAFTACQKVTSHNVLSLTFEVTIVSTCAVAVAAVVGAVGGELGFTTRLFAAASHFTWTPQHDALPKVSGNVVAALVVLVPNGKTRLVHTVDFVPYLVAQPKLSIIERAALAEPRR